MLYWVNRVPYSTRIRHLGPNHCSVARFSAEKMVSSQLLVEEGCGGMRSSSYTPDRHVGVPAMIIWDGDSQVLGRLSGSRLCRGWYMSPDDFPFCEIHFDLAFVWIKAWEHTRSDPSKVFNSLLSCHRVVWTANLTIQKAVVCKMAGLGFYTCTGRLLMYIEQITTDPEQSHKALRMLLDKSTISLPRQIAGFCLLEKTESKIKFDHKYHCCNVSASHLYCTLANAFEGRCQFGYSHQFLLQGPYIYCGNLLGIT